MRSNFAKGTRSANDVFIRSLRRIIPFILLAVLGTTLSGQLAAPDSFFRQADHARTWHFPRDHGLHAGYAVEWWYLTGNLADDNKRAFGYQLTFFRRALIPEQPDLASAWAVRDVYFAHLVISDMKNNTFALHEKISRTGPGLAGSDSSQLNLWLHNWRLFGDAEWHAEVAAGSDTLRLTLKTGKHPLLHGVNGLIHKGPEPGQASFYYSYPTMQTKGELVLHGKAFNVHGASWFDHEFSSQELGTGIIGWDWFGLQLKDGAALMIYLLRHQDGSFDRFSAGTYSRDDKKVHLAAADIRAVPVTFWKSDATGASYPVAWDIDIIPLHLSLRVSARIVEQELRTSASTRIDYWEGPVTVKDRDHSQSDMGSGYMELTGYAHSLQGRM